MVIHTENLTKFYGRERGIADISLDVREGEVFGFLGPNGAGKTTTMRILLDFIRPSRGRAFVFGKNAHAHAPFIKKRVGFLPGEYGMYDRMSANAYLDFLAGVRGVACPLRNSLIDSLNFDPSKRIKSYSHGNRQKLAIVQAFMHDPELLILDEPTTGLDPLVQQEFYKLILDEKARGKTVFLCSHILPEVERVCDRVAILRQGRLVAVHEISELQNIKLKIIEVEFERDVPDEEFKIEGVRKVERSGATVRLQLSSDINAALQIIASHPVKNLKVADAGLEDIFMEYYTGDNAAE